MTIAEADSAERRPADHLRLAMSHCRTAAIRDVVLITRRGNVQVANSYAEHLPSARIHQVSVLRPLDNVEPARAGVTITRCRSVDAIGEYLSGIAAPQLIVDLATNLEQQQARFAALVHFLDDDPGHHPAYLVREPATEPPEHWLAATLTRLTAAERAPLSPFSSRDDRLIEAIDSVEQHGTLTRVTLRGTRAVKLRDRSATATLDLRRGDSWGAEIATRPARQFTSRASVWTNEPAERFSPVMNVPQLFLREYRDVVCAPRGLAVSSGAMLPVSFHKSTAKLRSHSPLAPNVSHWNVSLDPELADAPTLEGVYYHLDSPYPWGFGHFMGEDMSKLWAWEKAKARHPDLKVLLSSAAPPDEPPPDGGPAPYQVALLAGLGIRPDDIVCLERPTRVELLVGASRMWDNPRYVHPGITELWDARREALRTPVAERRPTPKKLFVSRGATTLRHCLNAHELELFFASHGYEVIEPGSLDLRAQVDVFAGAEVVAGFGGSAMFNMMHTCNPVRSIVIASSGYTARNEYLIAAARGGDYHHFNCEPIEPDPPQTLEADYWKQFHWDFKFDFARDGAALEALLGD